MLRLFVDSRFLSPYAMCVDVALREKGLAFDVTRLDLAAGVQHAAAFAQMSLTQRVPTLLHDEFALSESSAICEYLDETFKATPLYPSAPKARARARQVQAWLRSDFMPLRAERPTEVLFEGAKRAPLSEAADACADRLFAAALALLPEGGHSVFDHWCIADLDLAIMLNRLVLHGDAVPPSLVSYARSQWQRPSVQAWVMQPRPPIQR